MTAWTTDQLDAVDAVDEIRIASRRPDGTRTRPIIIWGVTLDGELYVRSAYGSDNPWFRRALRAGAGAVVVAGVEHDVSFSHVDPAEDGLHERIDDAYRTKYSRYGGGIVGTVVGPRAHLSTLRVDPA